MASLFVSTFIMCNDTFAQELEDKELLKNENQGTSASNFESQIINEEIEVTNVEANNSSVILDDTSAQELEDIELLKNENQGTSASNFESQIINEEIEFSNVEANNSSVILNEILTSKLGHLRSGAVIYQEIGDLSSVISANDYYNMVYYIKKQAELNGELYYLISTQPSATQGVVGWVKAVELNHNTHQWQDSISKTFYIEGTGRAYKKAWGGSKDVVYGDMTVYKDQEFKVNLTEKVGNDIWYQGELNGQLVWLPSRDVTEAGPVVPIIEKNSLVKSIIEKSSTSRLGHLNSGASDLSKY